MMKELLKAQLDSICCEITPDELDSMKFSCLYTLINQPQSETVEVKGDFYFEAYESMSNFEINANVVSLVDFNVIKNLITQLETVDLEEGYEFSLVTVDEKQLLSFEELLKVRIPFCNPKAEISSTTTILRNCYDSNCDTYGTLYGTKACSLYFLYCSELEKFFVVESKYYCY